MTVSAPAQRLIDADLAAADARRRLSATVAELQSRLDPSRLADIARTEAREVGTASLAAADQHRGVLLGTGAAIGLFLARGRLRRLFGRSSAQDAAVPAQLPPMAPLPLAAPTPLPDAPR